MLKKLLLAVLFFSPLYCAAQFSSSLEAYPNIVTPGKTASDVVTAISNPAYHATTTEQAKRLAIAQMYLDAGFDLSYDNGNDESLSLLSLAPTGGAPGWFFAPNPATSFSPDSPFYQAIDPTSPRVLLPAHYFPDTQVNSVRGTDSDGIGYGESLADSADPLATFTSQWYSIVSTFRTFNFRASPNWQNAIPANPAGDKHVIFIDPVSETFVGTYMTSVNNTGGPHALYASDPTSITGMGDRGGSTAAKFAELPVMVQAWEATDTTYPIYHAIGGPILKVWGGRVYPAYARDAGMLTGTNTCTGSGPMNRGLVPYGGVIQLDPSLNLSTLGLSLPARRILEAMQTYGYYVMDFGCTDFDIYTAVNEDEFEPYGGMYGNANGPGVQNEIKNVIANSNLYVVLPQVKH